MKHTIHQTLQTTLLASGLILFITCGGGSGGDTQAPVADTFTPDDGMVNVALDTTVSAVFDEAMIDLSIAEDSFYLKTANGVEVTATVAYDSTNDTASLTPIKPLALLTHYTATLTNDNLDMGGNELAETSWSFQTRDGVWQGMKSITASAGIVLPSTAIDTQGNVFAVWSQNNGALSSIYANFYNASTHTWSAPELLEEDDTGSAYNPKVVIDSNGNTMAVWLQSDGTRVNLYSNYYNNQTGSWASAYLLENNDIGSASSHQVISDNEGNIIITWSQIADGKNSIYAKRYVQETHSWGVSQLLEHDSTGHANYPMISIDYNGNAIVVWQQDDGISDSIYANRYSITSHSWEVNPQLLENNHIGNAAFPNIVSDATGNMVVAWIQDDGAHSSIYSNRYSIATHNWGGRQLLKSDNTTDANRVTIAGDTQGNVLITWVQPYNGFDSIYANYFSTISGHWGGATLIENSNAGDTWKPTINLDNHGNVIALWSQYDGSHWSIYTNRYSAATQSWGTVVLLENSDAGSTMFTGNLAIDASGNAIVVWSMHDDTRFNLYYNRYTQDTNHWTLPILLEDDDSGNYGFFSNLVMNQSGQAMVTSSLDNGMSSYITSNSFQ